MTRTREWCFLSDLHLDGGRGSRGVNEALPRFLATVLGTSSADERTLVLLGDTFDLGGGGGYGDAKPDRRLAMLISSHVDVLQALGDVVRSGTTLHVVGGHRDIDLTRSGAEVFARALGTRSDDPMLRFSPWLLHEPGVFYAEHGAQHQELSRAPTTRSVRRAEDGRDPDESAAVNELTDAALDDLAALSRFSLTGLAGRVTRTARTRRPGRERAAPALARHAEDVHLVLASHDLSVPAYVFGHTHRAEKLELPGPPAAAYLNAGTWCGDVRGEGPDRHDPQLFPYVTITDDGSDVHADVHYWDAGPLAREARIG